VPITIASRPIQNPRPSTIATEPVNATVMFTCGANHTENNRRGLPYRWSSGIGAMPWVSTDMSPGRTGRRPLKADSVSAREAMEQFDHGGRSAGRPTGRARAHNQESKTS
jgi:hypothetical protein